MQTGKNEKYKTLRLILGDQLNEQHSWFQKVDGSVLYVLMEIRTETDYAWHHIQKVVGFFAAMRAFATELMHKGHAIHYITLDETSNKQSFPDNLQELIQLYGIECFEYQLPDEYRVDSILKQFSETLPIPVNVSDSEHFYSQREELGSFFEGKKQFLMESFYRHMRKKHKVLMQGNEPYTGKWNYDVDNRKKMPVAHCPPAPKLFANDVREMYDMLQKVGLKTIGQLDATGFLWPINRNQSLLLLDFFVRECLPSFGTYQDAMTPHAWSIYHSRLSFSLNTKMISPKEVIDAAIAAFNNEKCGIEYNQLEGFVRQIIGWREYMRGIYWLKMPDYALLNYLGHTNPLPVWFWTGKTKMNCLKHAIGQSLHYAYAHHIQRLMITGNFALLAGVHPDEVDAWYLGIYIDALDWVELTNTRGMSQFADGGIVGTKPYINSATYIDKMSHYCGTCYYKKALKVGKGACPFNSLYWNFYDRHRDKLAGNPRIGMMYTVWDKMKPNEKAALLEQAALYLETINEL